MKIERNEVSILYIELDLPLSDNVNFDVEIRER